MVSELPPAAGAVEHNYHIGARLERLPIGMWHTVTRTFFAAGSFFDAFDSLAIASVLPVLLSLWKLHPAEIGTVIAIGYFGQLIGAVFFGWLAERVGRIPIAVTTILIFSIGSLACAFADTFGVLLALRFIQGLGLGGEVPVMNAYMNEIANSRRRGRFFLLPQLAFPIGIAAAAFAGRWIVPNLGWQAMFVLGAIPALLVFPLARMLPESPRWLAARGRGADADRVLSAVERKAELRSGKELPPISNSIPVPVVSSTRFTDLFRGIYARRTLTIWALYFSTYFVGYGVTTWLPTIYHTVYKLSVSQALSYGAITTLFSLCSSVAVAFALDRTGRKSWFSVALLLAAVPLIALQTSATMPAIEILVLVSLSVMCVNSVAISLSVFAGESYPTHLRALGAGFGTAWLRLSAIVGSYVVGLVLPRAGIGSVFLIFAAVAAAGGIVCILFATETTGRVLEELSPVL